MHRRSTRESRDKKPSRQCRHPLPRAPLSHPAPPCPCGYDGQAPPPFPRSWDAVGTNGGVGTAVLAGGLLFGRRWLGRLRGDPRQRLAQIFDLQVRVDPVPYWRLRLSTARALNEAHSRIDQDHDRSRRRSTMRSCFRAMSIASAITVSACDSAKEKCEVENTARFYLAHQVRMQNATLQLCLVRMTPKTLQRGSRLRNESLCARSWRATAHASSSLGERNVAPVGPSGARAHWLDAARGLTRNLAQYILYSSQWRGLRRD